MQLHNKFCGTASGLELAQCMARFGSNVTVFDKASEVLGKEDKEAAAIVKKQLEADGITFLMNVEYHLISNGGLDGHEIHVQLQKPGKRVIACANSSVKSDSA